MNLRTILLAAGVTAADVDSAVRDSRRVVRRVGAGAGFLSEALEQLGKKAPLGSRRQNAAFVASLVLGRVNEGASDMLRLNPRGPKR